MLVHSNYCIIVTKNFALGDCSGNILGACTSENLSQSEYFLFRMRPSAAPWASKRATVTCCSQFQRFKHSLESSFSSALPRSLAINVFFIVAVKCFFKNIWRKYSQQSMHKEQQFCVINISEIVRVDCKVGLQLLQIHRKLAGLSLKLVVNGNGLADHAKSAHILLAGH